jgi:hypothetical protein
MTPKEPKFTPKDLEFIRQHPLGREWASAFLADVKRERAKWEAVRQRGVVTRAVRLR